MTMYNIQFSDIIKTTVMANFFTEEYVEKESHTPVWWAWLRDDSSEAAILSLLTYNHNKVSERLVLKHSTVIP